MFGKFQQTAEALSRMDQVSKAIVKAGEVVNNMGKFMSIGLHNGVSGKAADAVAAWATAEKSAGVLNPTNSIKLIDADPRLRIIGETLAKHTQIAKLLVASEKMGAMV
jgi:hypothetical protein